MFAYSLRIRTAPRHVGAPGRLIVRSSLKPIFLKLLRCRSRAAELYEGACRNCRKVWQKFFCAWDTEFTGTAFTIVPVTYRRTGQLPGWPGPVENMYSFQTGFIFCKRGAAFFWGRRWYLGLFRIVANSACYLPYVCIFHPTAVHPDNMFPFFQNAKNMTPLQGFLVRTM